VSAEQAFQNLKPIIAAFMSVEEPALSWHHIIPLAADKKVVSGLHVPANWA
jgi:hypothetical protein